MLLPMMKASHLRVKMKKYRHLLHNDERRGLNHAPRIGSRLKNQMKMNSPCLKFLILKALPVLIDS
jgi:hypothetical protein